MKRNMSICLVVVVALMCILPLIADAASESLLSLSQYLRGYSSGNWSLVGVVDMTTSHWEWSSWFSYGTKSVSYSLWYDHWLFGAIWDDYYNDWGEGIYMIDKNM